MVTAEYQGQQTSAIAYANDHATYSHLYMGGVRGYAGYTEHLQVRAMYRHPQSDRPEDQYQDLTKQATFSSDNEQIAKVDGEGNLTVLARNGTAHITVTAYGLTAVLPVTVQLPKPVHISLGDVDNDMTKPTHLVLSGWTRDPRNDGYYPTPPTGPLTYPLLDSGATWSSSDATIATIDQDGVIEYTGKRGTVTFTASLPGVAGDGESRWSQSVNTATTMKDVYLYEGNSENDDKYLKASVHYSDGSTKTIPQEQFTWTSSNPNICIVLPNGDMHDTGEAGTFTITASYNGMSDSYTITTDSHGTLTNLSVTPLRYSQEPVMIGADANYSDGNYFDLFQAMGLTWTTTNTAVATVDGDGRVTFTGTDGDVTITAHYRGLSQSVTAKVDLIPDLLAMFIQGDVNYSDQPRTLKAHGNFSDNAIRELLKTDVTWTSSNTNVATIDNNGVLKFTGYNGTVTITATYKSGQVATVTTRVTNGPKGNVPRPPSPGGGGGGGTTPTPDPVTPTTNDTTTDPQPVPTPATFQPLNVASNTAVQQTVVNKVLDTEPLGAIPYHTDTKDHWASTKIKMAEKLGIASGYGDGSFRPNQTVTRAEFMTMLCRSFDIVPDNAAGDMANTQLHWAKGYVAALNERGIIGGYADGSFKPDQGITRAEVVTILNRLLDTSSVPQIANASFHDTGDHWAQAAIDKAAQIGIVNGVGENWFAPNKEMTRAETITVLLNAL